MEPCWIAKINTWLGNILCDHRPGANHHIITNTNGQHCCVGTNRNMVTYLGVPPFSLVATRRASVPK